MLDSDLSPFFLWLDPRRQVGIPNRKEGKAVQICDLETMLADRGFEAGQFFLSVIWWIEVRPVAHDLDATEAQFGYFFYCLQ